MYVDLRLTPENLLKEAHYHTDAARAELDLLAARLRASCPKEDHTVRSLDSIQASLDAAVLRFEAAGY